jgi:hypothetical protein
LREVETGLEHNLLLLASYFGICFSKEAHDGYIDSCSISGEDVDDGKGSRNGNDDDVDDLIVWGIHSRPIKP